MVVLVVGGTGGLGRLVVQELDRRGHPVRVLSRRPPGAGAGTSNASWVSGDLVSGAGLPAAVAGVHTVVNVVNAPVGSRRVMVDGGRRLIRAAAGAGVQHVVGIGIVGVEQVARWVPYYRVKLAEEAQLAGGAVPWTLLRATQFHELVASLVAGLARPPVAAAPAIRLQPVDRAEVAAAMVDAVEAGPAGRLPDVAGPQALLLPDLVRSWLLAHGRRRRTVTVAIPGSVGRRLREGALCNPDRATGRTTFEQWLAAQRRSRA